MYTWELIDVTEKVAFQMSNNNIYLAVLMRDFFRGGIFAVKIISANMPPPSFYRKYAPPILPQICPDTAWLQSIWGSVSKQENFVIKIGGKGGGAYLR